MSIFNKTVNAASEKIEPVFRFGSLERLGFQTRPADTRTVKELMATINASLARNPQLQEFKSAIKEMNPKHLNLVSDTLELANRTGMSMTQINLNETNQRTGKSFIKEILESFIKADKDNPEALDFAQEVINHTDATTSKYTLASISNAISHPETRELFGATKEHVSDLAEQALAGGYTGDFRKQKNFVDYIGTYINLQAKPEKINFLKKLSDNLENTTIDFEINVPKLIYGDTPMATLEGNLPTLNKVVNIVDKQGGKPFDVVDFISKNVDLV